MGQRPCQNLSARQRRSTPYRFAVHLLSRVLAHHGGTTVAALWVEEATVYHRLWPAIETWPESRNALLYAGPWPVICHPPCGPWGFLRWKCVHQSREHGVRAMEHVHRWGGVVEQPLGSSLFKEHGDGRRVEVVDQCDYGHQARKRTLLYWVR